MPDFFQFIPDCSSYQKAKSHAKWEPSTVQKSKRPYLMISEHEWRALCSRSPQKLKTQKSLARRNVKIHTIHCLLHQSYAICAQTSLSYTVSFDALQMQRCGKAIKSQPITKHSRLRPENQKKCHTFLR